MQQSNSSVSQNPNETSQPNPFRNLHKKDKEKELMFYQQVAGNLKVERVKYKTNNLSPGEDS